MKNKPSVITYDQWNPLRQLTDARIGLGHCGGSLPTRELLDFQLCHAKARDSVLLPLDCTQLQKQLEEFSDPVFCLHSKAADRQMYLQRPDLGRRLNEASQEQLRTYMAGSPHGADVVIAICDGLSSAAIAHHAVPFISELLPQLKQRGLSVAPLTIVEQGRVAVGDDVCSTLHGKMVVTIVGERPGLSSPDSMGIYYTYAPYPGITDERRNCLSNIRHAGMSYSQAVARLVYLIEHALVLATSGVQLKDNSQRNEPQGENFLLPLAK